MKKVIYTGIVSFLLLFALAACGADNDNAGNNGAGNEVNNGAGNGANNGNDAGDSVAAEAESLYRQSCISCHGDQLQGAGRNPALNDVGERLSKDEIFNVIDKGRGGMPAFGNRLNDSEIDALAEWLAAKK